MSGKEKGIFPVIVKKIPLGYLKIELERSGVSITAVTDEGREESGVTILAEELSDTISALKKAEAILKEKKKVRKNEQ
mgnify:CR=1 FL=1